MPAAETTTSVLVSEVEFRTTEFAGLTEPVEICAVSAEGVGEFWAELLESTPPYAPESLPEEGTTLLRRLGSTAATLSWQPDATRRLEVPPRTTHRDLGFPPPVRCSSELFIELRYSMPPSLIANFDFDDLRHGLFRAFALPLPEPLSARLLLVLDEAVWIRFLAAAPRARRRGARGQPRRARGLEPVCALEDFLGAAAGGPPSHRWASTLDDEMEEAEADASLFQHQRRSVAWMARVEAEVVTVAVTPLDFAGAQFGKRYDVRLPVGGVLAHPPGAGKTRIVAHLLCRKLEETVVVCPDHLLSQWRSELAEAGSTLLQSTTLLGFQALADGDVPPSARLIVDEPQEAPPLVLGRLQHAADASRIVWLLCGTAPLHRRLLGPLLLGVARYRDATTKDEWSRMPTLAWVYRLRHLRDPEWACLPLPPLQIEEVAVAPQPAEALAAQMAALSGYVVDSVLLLNFGQKAARLAQRERRRLLRESRRQWQRVSAAKAAKAAEEAGEALVEVEEAEVSSASSSDGDDGDDGGAEGDDDGDGWAVVEARCRRRLRRVRRRLSAQQLEQQRQHRAWGLTEATSDGVLRRLDFLAADAALDLHVQRVAGGVWEVVGSVAPAEWNASFAAEGYPRVGNVLRMPLDAAEAPERCEGAILVAAEPTDGTSCCALAWRAAALGALALLVAGADESAPSPIGYGADEEAPPVPAARVTKAAGELLLGGAAASLKVLDVTVMAEEEGHMADVVALADAADESHAHALVSLLAEEARSARPPLRRRGAPALKAEHTAAECPVCLQPYGAAAAAVLPDCFHMLCRDCYQQTAAGATSLRCPMCRVEVETWHIVAFAVGTAEEGAAEAEAERRLLPAARWRALPTKLRRMLSIVSDALADGDDERVLIFVQFLAHVEYVHALLAEAGIVALALAGDLSTTMDALARFGGAGEPRVLVLSSQHHASGINLQCARNLVLLHPYCTPSATYPEAVRYHDLAAFERQAIGRVRRYPQQRPVRVWKLVCAGTVEQALGRGLY